MEGIILASSKNENPSGIIPKGLFVLNRIEI